MKVTKAKAFEATNINRYSVVVSIGVVSRKTKLTKSQCDDKDRKDITESFCFQDFTAKELLTDVRKSGLFSIMKIDSKVLEILNSCQENLAKKEKEVIMKNDAYLWNQKIALVIKLKDQTIKQKEDIIKQKEDKMKRCYSCRH